jgi:benzodiazapine receptor
MKDWNSIWVLLLFIAVCFVAAGAGAIFTSNSVSDWYPTLRKPSSNPPAWVFGPVWTVLYLMMAVAAWLVWRRLGFEKGAVPLGLFALQLALNALWSPLFFGLRSPWAGLVDIVPLWAAIIAVMVSFWRVSPPAGALLIPYWWWVSFAAALNFTIWRMNR